MSLSNKTPSGSYKDILKFDNTGNGVKTDGNETFVTDGNGVNSAIKLSDRKILVNPSTDNTSALKVSNASGSSKFVVDTTNNEVKALGNHVNTMYADFGLYDYTPATGRHQPMIANNMMFSDSGVDYAGHDAFGTGTDPATTLDVSGHASRPIDSIPTFWYVMDAIKIDAIRVFGCSDSSVNLNYHVYSYDLDISSNHGDLSNGTLLAHINTSLACTSTAIKTDELVIDSANVAQSKVIIAFVENESGTDQITTTMKIKYHLT